MISIWEVCIKRPYMKCAAVSNTCARWRYSTCIPRHYYIILMDVFPFFSSVRSTKGASKHRRDLINNEISVLRDLLPLPESARQRLSQLQIMSLGCCYIRKCNYLARCKFNNICSYATCSVERESVIASPYICLCPPLQKISDKQYTVYVKPNSNSYSSSLTKLSTALYFALLIYIFSPFSDGTSNT